MCFNPEAASRGGIQVFADLAGNSEVLNKIFFVSERLIIFDGLEDVFGHIVKTAVSLIHAEAATIRVFDFSSGKLKIVKGYGVSSGFLSQPPISLGEGITGHVVLEGKPFISEDVVREPICKSKELVKIEGIRSMMSVPLKTKEKCIGCINVFRKKKEPFTEQDMLLLNIFGLQAAEAIEKANLVNELKKQASYDFLTGIYNKSALLNAIETNICLSHRHSMNCSIIFMDIDNFKKFNDAHGHILGDKLLCDFALMLKKLCRKSDVIGRFGGEEFIVLAPHTNKKQASILAEKIRTAVSKHKFIGNCNTKVNITFSSGIATFPEDGPDTAELTKKADNAMYLSKKAGKDRVTPWTGK